MITLSSQHKGLSYAALSGMLYGFLAYFGMNIITEGNYSVVNMLFWRFFITTIVFFLVLIPMFKNITFDTYQMLYALILGGLFYSGGAGLYFIASEHIGTGLSMVIFFTYPTMVAILNWLFHRRKITLFYYASFILTGIGIFLLSDKKDLTFDIYGIVFSALAALSYAFYMITSKKQSRQLNPFLSSFMVSVGCTALFLTIALIDQSFQIPTTSLLWINILGVSLVGTALPIIFLLIGLKYINSTKASIVSVLEPVITVIIGVILLGEVLSPWQATGIITILAGTLIIQFDKGVESR